MTGIKTMKFVYYTNGTDTVVAETIFHGQKFKGEARCAPEDEFDLEFGKKLAALRCELKARKADAKESIWYANEYAATARFFRAQSKHAMSKFENAQARVDELEKEKKLLYAAIDKQ